MVRARHPAMTIANILALVLYAAAHDTLETQAGVKRIRSAASTGRDRDVFAMRNNLNVWAHRVREHSERIGL